jgi:hypothetical protein
MKTLDNILEEISNLKIKSMRDGVNPTEVWIGPEEVKLILLHLSSSNIKQLTGLTIRLSKLNGIRVGRTYQND